MSARPVCRADVLEDWPASRDPKTTGSSGALTENDFEYSPQRRCVGYGENFYYVITWEIIKFANRSKYEPNYESRQSILGEE